MSISSAAVAPAKTSALIQKNTMLVVGGWFSLAFAVFQISGIWWPASAIKWFGGPDQMSINRPVSYALLCLVVGLGVAVFGLYTLSGAGKIARLPLLRTMVTIVTVIYLLRGLLLFPQLPFIIQHPTFWRFALFSLISLTVGFVHLGGLVKLFRFGRPGE